MLLSARSVVTNRPSKTSPAMIEENSAPIHYLDREDLRRVHSLLARWAASEDEPIPDFGFAKDADIDTLVLGPRQRFFGKDAYETIEEKAAFLFYSINKRQIFLNGNKRMSTLCLIVFLALNDRTLNVGAGELTAKALWLANTESLEFPAVKEELARWIADHVRPSERPGSFSEGR